MDLKKIKFNYNISSVCVEHMTIAGNYYFVSTKEDMPDEVGIIPAQKKILSSYGIKYDKSEWHSKNNYHELKADVSEICDLGAKIHLLQAQILRYCPDKKTLENMFDPDVLREKKLGLSLAKAKCNSLTRLYMESAHLNCMKTLESLENAGAKPKLAYENSMLVFDAIVHGKTVVVAKNADEMLKVKCIKEAIVDMAKENPVANFHRLTIFKASNVEKFAEILLKENCMVLV